jgi:MFS family permease
VTGAEAHIFDMQRVIQLAVAPVFLLTAIGTIINALTGRLARAVDRRRRLEEDLPAQAEGERRSEMIEELHNLARRIRLVLWSMALAVVSALLVCLMIGVAFIGAFVTVDMSHTVASLFVAAIAVLSLCLMLFLREVFLAALTVRHAPDGQAGREARRQATTAAKKASESTTSAAASAAPAPESVIARTTPSAK